MMLKSLSGLAFLFLYVCVVFSTDDHDHEGHNKVFDKVLDYLNVKNQTMSLGVLDTLTSKLFGRFKCSQTTQSTATPCPTASLATKGVLQILLETYVQRQIDYVTGFCDRYGMKCLRGQDIFTALAINDTSDLHEEQFEDLSIILFYHVLTIKNNCRAFVQLDQNSSYYQAQLINLVDKENDRKLDIKNLHIALEAVHDVYNGHEDDGDKDDHDHDKHGHSEEKHDHDDEVESSVTKEHCISPGMLFDNLNVDPDVKGYIDIDHLGDISSYLIYYFLTGAKMNDSCRLLPRPSLLYHELTDDYLKVTNETFTKTSFTRLYNAVLSDSTKSSDSGSSDDGHNHRRRKREAEHVSSDLKEFQTPRCYSADQLLAIHKVMNGSAIPEKTIKELCPSLLYLKVFDACHSETKQTSTTNPMTQAERYGYGFLAVFVICLCSLTGVIALGCSLTSSYFVGIMSLFIGLAVGSLFTDALLHLLPTAFGLHKHSADDGHDHGGVTIVVEDYVWFALVTIAGVYVFYLLEVVMAILGGDRDSRKGHSHSHITTEVQFSNTVTKTDSKIELTNNKDTNDTGSCEGDVKKDRPSVAVMVILGDSIHNFADGLAIGAAFSQSGTLGLATAIAVFCHELPHELGDFAILVQSGLTVKKALFWNFMSSLLAVVGLLVGLSVSADFSVRQWIFAVTAGLFIYIALVDMIPEMINSTVTAKKHKKLNLALNNIGMFIGTLILVLLSIFEEHIKI